MNIVEKLVNCPLFDGIQLDELINVFYDIDYQIREFKKNDMIIMENDLCNHLMIVLEGTVRGEMTDYSGKIIKIEDIEACRPLAPAFLFGSKNRYPVTIIANEIVKLLSVSQKMVLKIFRENEVFLINYLNLISNRAQFLSQKIKFLSFQTIKGKLSHYLLQINKEGNTNWFTIPLSQKDLAELFGVTRPSLSRAIREMDNEGIIKARGKRIMITDRGKLIGLFK